MNMTEKNGQPSMEEILASIRRIIAEEPGSQHHGELRGTPIMLKGDSALDDAGDFDLPAIFRSSPPPAGGDRQAPLLGRLTDAIRSATAAQPEERPASNGATYAHAEPVEPNGSGPDAAGGYPALSTLKPVRSDGRAGEASPSEPHSQVNGTALGADIAAPAASLPSPAPTTAAPVSAAPPADEPKRVMAAFKDTHFLRMSAPVAVIPPPQPAPVVEPSVAVPVAPPPPETEAPVDFRAIIPGQIDRAAFVNTGPATPPPLGVAESRDVPGVVPESPAISAAVVTMPPPPLPAAAPVSAVPAAVRAEPGAAEATDSIEDTTADLLRPMLRQWLADNMPRMVEKALHIEIAESVKPPKKP